MKKFILSLLFIPSISLACVVHNDGSYNCTGSESTVEKVTTKEDEVIFKKSRLVLNSIVSKMEEVCTRKQESLDKCLCDYPILKSNLTSAYNAIVLQKPEWDNKVVIFDDKKIKFNNINSIIKYNSCKI